MVFVDWHACLLIAVHIFHVSFYEYAPRCYFLCTLRAVHVSLYVHAVHVSLYDV
jgi:hypothetical protein